MVTVTEQEKRLGIASELADIEMRQRAIVQWNSTIRSLIHNFKDERETLETIADEDEKNLRMIETVMTNFGMRVEPKEFTKGFVRLASQRIDDSGAPVVEKLGVYALTKQNQAMCGFLVHKAGQLSMVDVKAALALFEGIQTSMEKQVGQMTGIMEKVAVQLISGEEPASGVTGRLRDMAATVAGAVINAVGKPADEMNVLNVLRMDHVKVKTLFREIKSATTAVDKNDLFYQVRLDLLSHAEAEEETVYQTFQQYEDLKAEFDTSWSEHEQIRTILDVISNVEASSQLFEERMKDLRAIVEEHVEREEDEIFKMIEAKSNEDDLKQLARDFLTRKAQIQEQLSPHITSGSVSGSSPEMSPPAMM
ncbi:MAG TPA: hemerythrin domain-containing protein [Oligoflexus sp.]|uniref:hemerythrin domain-containing protein n=1 Tax=Oligoflexus sp. TaxID=1971216 RepID=UPI002D755021|nr:hemerythrin domain-containing protein [Oligoflexus sp.]HYX31465.1 hemerythrin domain-containing protein [Oligoflexus sp.]